MRWRRRARAALLVGGIVTAAGCAGASGRPAAAAPASSSCAGVAAVALRDVARRIYAQAARGGNVVSATRRLARSTRLATAVAAGDRAATRAALRPLLVSQIHRIVITRGGRVLASVGTSAAPAPVRGVIRLDGRPVGRYVLAVADDASIAGITQSVTGATVLMRAGGRQVAGAIDAPAALPRSGTVRVGLTTYRVASYAGAAFPRGSLRTWLLTPGPASSQCGSTAAQTRVDTLTGVARRLLLAESDGSAVHRVLRHVATDAGFRAAVAADDPIALRAAIVRFFEDHQLHVVRIRATDAAGQLINDVGGPDVLAPASTDVRAADGRLLGRVTLSVQDDTGYIKLVRRFTGARVVLRSAAGIVPGSASPNLRGTHVTLTAQAFPSGPLTATLTFPSTRLGQTI